MITVLSSKSSAHNQKLIESKRKPRESNAAWLKRNFIGEPGQAHIVLVGGKSRIDFRLRTAQAHVRRDLLPSYWSHAMLLHSKGGKNLPQTVHEISLEPAKGFGFPTPENGLQEGRLQKYFDADAYPNIALIALPLEYKELIAPIKRFKFQSSSLDALELILHWLEFAWGVGKKGNPLFGGYGLPSTAMLEAVLGAAGFDLTPGLETRSSCPEAIWQAAKWWHKYYEAQNKAAPIGRFTAEHELN